MKHPLSSAITFIALAGVCFASVDPSKAFLDAFAVVKPGQELSTIALPEGWPNKAQIQLVSGQTGKWDIWGEPGTTVFRLYPFFEEKEGSQMGGCHCVVLKIDSGDVSVKELIAAFHSKSGHKAIRVVEYALYEPPGKLLQRTPEKKKEANQSSQPMRADGPHG